MKGIVVVLGILLCGAVAWGLITVQRQIQHQAQIKATGSLGIYSNYACTEELTSYDWGAFNIGETKELEFWMKNIGNINITISWNLTDDEPWEYDPGDEKYWYPNATVHYWKIYLSVANIDFGDGDSRWGIDENITLVPEEILPDSSNGLIFKLQGYEAPFHTIDFATIFTGTEA